MMPPQHTKRNRILLIIAIILALGAVSFALFHPKKKLSPAETDKTVGPTTVYHDPVSGEDISTQQGVAQEQQTASPTIPVFAGFDKLLNMGMTLSQLNSLYAAFEQYQSFASNKVQISLAVNDLVSQEPNQSDPLYRWSIVSHIVVNKKTTYRVQLYYWGVNSAQLVLKNADGSQQIFQSPAMNTSDTPDID